MFNWFKSKVELKKDTSIMSSFHNKKGLKIGSEIVVPNNFECLIFHKGKCYNTLKSGKYKMDNTLFKDLIEHQKQKSKKKYVKCVCHYINLSSQKFELKFKKQIYVIEFKIDNPSIFTPLALLYTYKVDNEYILNTLNDIFYELLLHHKGDYKQIKNDSLKDYGIKITTFIPNNNNKSIFNNENDTKSNNTSSILCNNNSSSQEQETNEIQETSSTKTKIETSQQDTKSTPSNNQPTLPTCPKCNNIAKFNTTYCLRCGYKLP
jgi:hypothetical protein